MSFLNPWFWLGAVAVGAPLWLHLRRKDREKIIRFAALRFLEDQPIARRAPLQLKNILLFLLRLSAVLLVVTAFARPFFHREETVLSSSHVYILDNTLSRQVDKGMERDRDFIIGKIRSASAREQIAVVELGIQPKVVVNFGDAPQEAEAKLRALQPTFQRGAFIAALRQANILLKQSLGENKEITVLTDDQENQWTENLNSPPFLTAGTVQVPNIPARPVRTNFYLCDPKLLGFYTGETSMLQCVAQLGYIGTPGKAEVVWTLNGKEVARNPLDLDPKSDKIMLLSKWEADPNHWVEGSVRVEGAGDELPQDNSIYFSYPPVMEGRVALLTESLYLKSALSGDVAKGKWKTQVLLPSALAELLAAPAGQDADILVIDGNYLQSADARRLVQRYLSEGRGVFMSFGKISTLQTGFLQEMGFEPRLFSESKTAEPLKPIRYFVPDSPIFQPFMASDFGNLMEVKVGNNVVLGNKLAKPLLFSQEGDGLLFEGNKGTGKFLLATFAFDRRQTDWVIHPSFVPFLDLALQYLRPQPVLNATVEPGEIWQVQVPMDREIHEVVLRSGEREMARTVVPPSGRAAVRAPDEPGLYSLAYDGDPKVEQMLAVNVASKESELRYLQTDPDAIKAWTLSDPEPAKPTAVSATVLSAVSGQSQDWWWKCLLAAVLCLFLEMALVAMRREETT